MTSTQDHPAAADAARAADRAPAPLISARVQRSLPRALASLVAFIAISVLLGWLYDIQVLKSVWPGLPPMLPITALGLLAASVALAAATLRHWAARIPAGVLAVALIFLGGQSLAEFIFELGSPLRPMVQFLAPQAYDDWPLTMSQISAAEFILYGLAVLLGARRRPGYLFTVIATTGLLIAGVSLLGYLFGARGLLGAGVFQMIAVNSAFAFMVLFTGALAWRCDAGWPSLLIGATPAARAARTLFAIVIVMPIACAWVAAQGWEMGLYDAQFRLAILTLSTIGLLSALVLFNSRGLRRAESTQMAAAAALAESEARFRHMADNAPGMVWVTDAEHRCTYVSKNWCVVTGQSEEHALGWGWTDALHPDDRTEAAQRFVTARETCSPFQSEYRIRRADGQYAWMINSANPRFDAQGAFLGYIGSLLDITERRALEVQLRHQAELLDQTHDAVVMWSEAGGIRYWNRGAADLYGYTQEEALGQNIHELLATTFPEPLADIEAQLRTKGFWSGELKHAARDGRKLIVESRQTVTNYEGLALVMEVNRDITTRKAFEHALRQSEERLRLATEAANIGVWTWDITTDTVHWNAQCRAITGVTRTPGGREELWRLMHPDDRELVEKAEREAIQNRNVYRVEFRVVRPDGVVRWIACVGRADYGDSDKAQRLLGLLMDITEQRAIEQALRDADRRKNEFLAMLGHELRNPLAPIRNAALILRKQSPPESAAKMASEIIDRQVRHMVRLVDDLLDVSRITLGRITIRKERVNLGPIVASAVEASRPMIEKSRHELTIALSGETIELDADPTRLSQVILNLLNNAVKYTPPGGRIYLTTSKIGDAAVISVRDTGIGLEPEMLSFVFGMFTQVESANDRAQGGLGIGLALARALIDLHGGRIEARSEGAGKGSEFIVTLPLARTVQPTATLQQFGPQVEASEARRRVLVVDDNIDGAESLAMHLRMAGLDARALYEGRAVVQVVQSFQPEVVVLDIGLPDLSGYVVAQMLRERHPPDELVLIALTGWGQEEDKRRAREAGFDHHFTKPVDPELVSQLIGKLRPPHDASATAKQA